MAKILLVEDDSCLSTVNQWLTFQKHTVETALTGLETAMEQLNYDTFDIVILDWHLPDLTGLEICRRLRAQGGTTPVLMLSGNDSPKEHQEGLSAGANCYLKKPFQLKDLSWHLQQLLNQAREKT